jgi:hypothetical protein
MQLPAVDALAILRKGREIVRPLAERARDHQLWNGYLASFDRDIARLEQQAAG